jgi:glycosyltransferase involved in cell wall biosynthesis
MKIAQIAPLMESVPPKMYGGTERIVSYLTEELVRLGHDVTLFASGDSKTRARLIPGSSRALRLADCCDPLPHHLLMLDDLRQYADDFDALHFHIDYLQYLMLPGRLDRCITTLHGRTDLADQQPFYRRFSDVSLVSISNDQRRPMPPANWAGTVYHGLPRDLLSYRPAPRDGYLAFLGRISPEKRPDLAIEIARRTGRRLKIAAKVDRVDRDYFNDRIKPLLNDPAVEFVGEVNEVEKDEFLGGATALLFPIDWPEPFGLVMIEAMACGTPVVAFRRGSVPEVIESGVTGLIVDDVAGAVQAVNLIENLDRRAVRRAFEERFSVERMAADYLAIYERLSYRGPVDEPATGTA